MKPVFRDLILSDRHLFKHVMKKLFSEVHVQLFESIRLQQLHSEKVQNRNFPIELPTIRAGLVRDMEQVDLVDDPGKQTVVDGPSDQVTTVWNGSGK